MVRVIFAPLAALIAISAAAPQLGDLVDDAIDASSIIDRKGKLTTIQGNPKRFTFYDMPTPGAGPCDLCTGPDGALWGEDQLKAIIFRIDPKTEKVEEFPIPWTLPPVNVSLPLDGVAGRGALACAIRPGADGNIYASTGTRNQMVQVKLPERTLKVFTPPNYNPAGDLQPFNDFYTGPHGMYFTQTTGQRVTVFDYKTQKFTRNYKVRGTPLGMFYGSDNRAYFTELLGNRIGRITPKTGKIEEFDVPLPQLLGPAVIRVEDKGWIYFTAFFGNGIGRMNMKTGKMEGFTYPSPFAFPAEDTKDKYGRVWFSTATQNKLNYLLPESGRFVSIVQPNTTVADPISVPLRFEIASHYGPMNSIWFTQELSNRVGRYQLY